jgi:hypothetical protein
MPATCPARRLVLRYFRHAPPPFQYLAAPAAPAPPAAQLARSSLRGMQLLPGLRWPIAAALPVLLQHDDADVRWCAVHCAALAFGLQDASRTEVCAAAALWQNLAPRPPPQWQFD